MAFCGLGWGLGLPWLSDTLQLVVVPGCFSCFVLFREEAVGDGVSGALVGLGLVGVVRAVIRVDFLLKRLPCVGVERYRRDLSKT